MAQQVKIDIRERRADDIPTAVEIMNAAHPPDNHRTVEEVRTNEERNKPENHALYLLAHLDGQAVGHGVSQHQNWDPPGRFSLSIAVHPAARRRGVARALYGSLLDHAAAHGSSSLAAFVHEHHLPVVRGWLERHDYRETERMRKSELSLDVLNMDLCDRAEARAAREGIRLSSLADDDSEDARRKLLDVSNLAERDVPSDEFVETSWELFNQQVDTPECLHDCFIIAWDGADVAGFTMLGHQTAERAFTWFTGVHPDHRGRGIALALKARCARRALERGYQQMQTFNHVNNPAMLAVNTRIGYRPLPEAVQFVKQLS